MNKIYLGQLCVHSTVAGKIEARSAIW